jgi:hypothetical protein
MSLPDAKLVQGGAMTISTTSKRWIFRALLLVAVSPVVFATLYGIELNKGDSSTQDAFAIILACIMLMVFMAW